MMTCKQVSEIVSQSLDRQLTWPERLRLRMHLLVCSACTRFQRQMHWLRTATARAATTDRDAGPGLPAAARDRIGRRLQQLS
jgi:predicted anti-sigma-YlaC factor YlaD